MRYRGIREHRCRPRPGRRREARGRTRPRRRALPRPAPARPPLRDHGNVHGDGGRRTGDTYVRGSSNRSAGPAMTASNPAAPSAFPTATLPRRKDRSSIGPDGVPRSASSRSDRIVLDGGAHSRPEHRALGGHGCTSRGRVTIMRTAVGSKPLHGLLISADSSTPVPTRRRRHGAQGACPGPRGRRRCPGHRRDRPARS